MFQKAGITSGYAWIPVYNEFWVIKISFSKIWLLIIYLINIGLKLVLNIMYLSLQYIEPYKVDDTWFFSLIALVLIVGLFQYAAYTTYRAFLANNLAKVFSLNNGMVACMIFFPSIAYMIIGLGQAQYKGIETNIYSSENS